MKRGLDELYVFIERGSPDGHEERFRDAADEFLNVRAGDVIFKIAEIEHPRFKRNGDDLSLQVTITLKQALLGFEIEIPHLDDHEVTLNKERG